MHPDGHVSNWFAQDQTREDISKVLQQNRLLLRDDDSVVPAAA
jgi:hypothetical protein